MAKLVVTYGTPSDIEGFNRHYMGVHIPLALKLPGLTKFETSEGPVITPAGPSVVHLVAMLHFEDMASVQAALAIPESQVAAADARRSWRPVPGCFSSTAASIRENGSRCRNRNGYSLFSSRCRLRQAMLSS